MATRRNILISGIMPEHVDALTVELRARGFAPSLQIVEDETQYSSALGLQNWDAVIVEESEALPVKKALDILNDLHVDTPLLVVDDNLDAAMAVRLIKQGVHNVVPRSQTTEICDALNHEIALKSKLNEIGKTKEFSMIAQSLFNSETDAIMLTDKHHHIKMVNNAFCQITGFPSKEILGVRPDFLESGCQDIDFFENFWKEVNTQGNWQGEVWYQRKNGETFPVWLSMSCIKATKGSITHYLAIFRDITRSKLFEEEIIRQASYDSLTELPNRTLFFDRLNTTSKQAKRSQQKFAVFFLDLDRFKEINDTRGHAIGDTLLKEVALRLKKSVRDSDTVARLGGDEFAVIVSEINDQDSASLVAKKIIETVAEPFMLSGKLTQIGVSIGISVYPKDGTDQETLLGRADIAMYHAKRSGIGEACYYQSGMTTPVVGTPAMAHTTQLNPKNKVIQSLKMKFTAIALVVLSVTLMSWAAANYPAVPIALMDLTNFETAAGSETKNK
ncbi:MAG: diguanylate cyclase [Rhodospirillales bacterium]|nr:diguanylate cyclase [Rhodospirillales bacterium]